MNSLANAVRLLPATLLLLSLAGCGESPDVEKMTTALAKSGMDSTKASCLAENWGKNAKGDVYNYISSLMAEGLDERAALNKARKKFGADYQAARKEAKKACEI